MISRLKNSYDKEIVSKLMTKLNYKNKHQVPRLTKVVLNMGLGQDASDNKKIKTCVDDIVMALFTRFFIVPIFHDLGEWECQFMKIFAMSDPNGDPIITPSICW